MRLLGRWMIALAVCIGSLLAVAAPESLLQQAQPEDAAAPMRISNPYHQTRQWKLWDLDPTPVQDNSISGDSKTVMPPQHSNIVWPADPDPNQPGQFMRFVTEDYAERKYAGIWDDAYSSRDNGHSYIRPAWDYDPANAVTIRKSHIHFVGGENPCLLGVNYTSQSTTGMGHDIANVAQMMLQTEGQSYFANILCAGPAHISFMERGPVTTDLYQALAPSYYNSVGSSGSETWALMKMVIAGGYLPKNVKALVKHHGLYPATMLYIWKAALPYDVPYDNELRHRVAYFSKGDHSDYNGPTRSQVNVLCNGYDETAHMRNMVNIARSMDTPPPISLLHTAGVEGGEVVYDLKTTMLVRQGKGQTVRIRVSTDHCYDLANLPVTVRWTVLYGNKDTTIVKDATGDTYTITVPWDDKMPRGRTSILLVANNGKFDSNPSIVNVYRTDPYKDDKNRERDRLPDNQRPQIAELPDQVVLPGEKLEVPIEVNDPEGFPVTLYRWADEVGQLDGNVFRWNCPADQKPGKYPVTIIASDRTCGYSLNSTRFLVEVSPIVAKLSADNLYGQAPLAVKFSSEGSRDAAATAESRPALRYQWEFDDGTTSHQASPSHTFTKPGFYVVKLMVSGPSGTHTSEQIVDVQPNWPLAINNGWSAEKGKDGNATRFDGGVWKTFDPYGAATARPDSATLTILASKKPNIDSELKERTEENAKQNQPRFRMESVADFKPPFYVEAVFLSVMDSTKSPTGFDLLGSVIGRPGNAAWNGWKVGIGHPTPETTTDRKGNTLTVWNAREICEKIRFSWMRSRLRVFVEDDPSHVGKLRYTGYVDMDTGRHFFRVDNMTRLHDKIGIVCMQPAGRFEIDQFQVWAPAERPLQVSR